MYYSLYIFKTMFMKMMLLDCDSRAQHLTSKPISNTCTCLLVTEFQSCVVENSSPNAYSYPLTVVLKSCKT